MADMHRFLTWTLLATAAVMLGTAVHSEDRGPAGRITIIQHELGVATTSAREPALLLPGPRLFWTDEEGPRGLALLEGDGAVLKMDERTDYWQSGLWQEQGLPEHVASFSAASLRNGVRKDGAGNIQGWSPDGAADPAGRWHRVEDRLLGEKQQVVYTDPVAQEDWVVGASDRFDAHASIAIDAAGRIWIAWDQGGDQWGKAGGLRQERELQLAVREGDQWQRVALPSMEDLIAEDPRLMAPFPGGAELPRLLAEDGGPLWMFYRVMKPYTPGESRTAARKVTWIIRAICLTSEGWSEPITLPESEGPNHDTLALVPAVGGGVWAAWTTDEQRRHLEDVATWNDSLMGTSSLRVARLRHEGAGHALTAVPEGSPLEVTALKDFDISTSQGVDAQAFVAPGQVRLWGDLHRHSDLSRCSMHEDGSVPDQYRYAVGAGRLDFVAITDHHQHLSPSAWSFLLDCADRFHEPEGLQAMFGFEAAFPDGHRNLIADIRSAVMPIPTRPGLDLGVAGLKPDHLIAIPH